MDQRPGGRWTFLTNHARVLMVIAQAPAARLRDIAAACETIERTVQMIVSDLERAGYLIRERDGRRTRYTLHLDGASGIRRRRICPSGVCWSSSPIMTTNAEAAVRLCRIEAHVARFARVHGAPSLTSRATLCTDVTGGFTVLGARSVSPAAVGLAFAAWTPGVC
jgi:hypothetical protein